MNTSHAPAQKGWLRSFGFLWIGQVFSLLGSGLVQFAIVWWLTRETGSAVVLTTATLFAILPDVLLSPFAGALVDRWNRKWVMILADTGVAVVTLILAVLFYFHIIEIWMIYVAITLRSLGGAFQYPAMQASTSLMVPEEHLARVSGANQTLRGILSITTPPLGALLMELLPFFGVISIDIITAFIAVTLVFLIKIPQPSVDRTTTITPMMVWKDVVEGAKFMVSWKGAVALVVIAAMVNFILAPAGALLPLLVTNYFNGDVWQFSIMESVSGFGMIAGGILLTIWGGFKKKIYTSILGIVGLGVGILGLGLAPASLFWVGVIGYGISGVMLPFANGPIMAIMQAYVPHEMQGRVFTLLNSCVGIMMPLSMLAAAPVAGWIGVRGWFILGGVITTFMGIGSFFVPSLMHIEDKAQNAQLTMPVGATAPSEN
jgi:DHA3 family macrolide efflux protein-like MFS transporter